jgi:hypothetical protein
VLAEFLEFFREWGLPGVIIGLLCFWVWTKDRQMGKQLAAKDKALAAAAEAKDAALKELNEKLQGEVSLRVEDAKQYTQLALDLQADVKESLNTIAKSADESTKLAQLVDRLIGSVERLIDRERNGRRR